MLSVIKPAFFYKSINWPLKGLNQWKKGMIHAINRCLWEWSITVLMCWVHVAAWPGLLLTGTVGQWNRQQHGAPTTQHCFSTLFTLTFTFKEMNRNLAMVWTSTFTAATLKNSKKLTITRVSGHFSEELAMGHEPRTPQCVSSQHIQVI